jgi:hypothetical protein
MTRYKINGRAVIRVKDNKQMAFAFDKKHAMMIAKKFEHWAAQGWPPKEG